MLLETSDRTSSFGKKPHIKKGYYPGKLMKVELFTEKDGTPKICKYGQQLIFEFEIWKADENDSPVEPLKDSEGKPVVISKFAYHRYKVTSKENVWKEGEYSTAITPRSKITAILEALGWKFSTENVDPESLIGNFAELNINDYQQNIGDDAYIASTIGDVGKLESSVEPKEITPEVQEQIDTLESKKNDLKKLLDEENLSEDGYKQGIESIDADIKKLKR